MEAFIRDLKEHFKGRFDIEVKEVCKNNGTGYTGMFFRNTEGVASPVICLERYFRDHGQGREISSIIAEIEEEISKAKAKVDFDPREL